MDQKIFKNMEDEAYPLKMTMMEQMVYHGNKIGERLQYRAPDIIFCRSKKEIEMAKKLVNGKLTKEEWCSYTRGAEKVLQEIWESQDPKSLV